MKSKENAALEAQSLGARQETRRPGKAGGIRNGRERVLVEFPSSLLERADEAAVRLDKNRSELIRSAVERMLDGIEKERFEQELAEGYVVNSARNLSVLEEFAHVDREGF